MTTFGGIPSESRGIRHDCADALLAASGAATPSMTPVPISQDVWRIVSPARRRQKSENGPPPGECQKEPDNRSAKNSPLRDKPLLQRCGQSRNFRAVHLSLDCLLEVEQHFGDAEKPMASARCPRPSMSSLKPNVNLALPRTVESHQANEQAQKRHHQGLHMEPCVRKVRITSPCTSAQSIRVART